MADFSDAKRRLQDYHYAIENPALVSVEKLNTPDRWAFPNHCEVLGIVPPLRSMPRPDCPEGKTAVRAANLIHCHHMRLTQATVEEAVVIARSLSGKFYCSALHKARFKFPHQEGDRFDPGYRMTVALPTMEMALFDACGHHNGVDAGSLAKLGDDLADFHEAWSVDADVRFLPVKRLAQFLQDFVAVLRAA